MGIIRLKSLKDFTITLKDMDILKKINLTKADGTKKPASEVFAGKEFICLYFSGHWCPPCRGFTPVLKDFYQEVSDVEIVFVSSDQSEEAMAAYMKESHGDWWAVEYDSNEVKELKSHFQVSGIPTLVVLDKNGKEVSKNGRGDVMGKGPSAVVEWKKAAR